MSYDKSIPLYGSTKRANNYITNKDKTNINIYQDKEIIGKEMDYTYNATKTLLDNELHYISNSNKTKLNILSDDTNTEDQENSISKAIRPEIGELEFLTTGVHCNYKTADVDFAVVREKYYEIKNEGLTENKRARSAYHIIQSFSPEENIDPRLCHQLGIELAEALGPYQCVVSTHMDKKHLHNHIIMNAYAYDGAHKYKDDKNAIYRLRNISNDISKKYGLSIIINPDLSKRNSYKEWLETKEGNSWKEKMRTDINTAMKCSKNWTEFVDIMRTSGYQLKENNNNTVTYTFPTNHNLKARDKSLGRDYTKEYLNNYWILKDKENNILETSAYINLSTQDKASILRKNISSIYVSKYTIDGRRRSELEMLFLLALKTIKAIGNMFADVSLNKLDTPNNKPLNWKLTTMEDSLAIVLNERIDTMVDLHTKIDNTGARLSHEKKVLTTSNEEYKNAEKLFFLIKDIDLYEQKMQELGITIDELQIPDYSKQQINQYCAEFMPMSATQKRELFLALDSQRLRLACSYDEISYNKAKIILDFLHGKIQKKPDEIISETEYLNNRLSKKYDKIQIQRINNLQEKYNSRPISENQRKRLNQIFSQNNVKIDIDSLSYFDGLVLINYYMRKNPFATHEHTKATDKNDMIPKSLVLQLEELLEIRNENIIGNVDDLRKEDAYKLYNYLLNKNYIPEKIKAIKPINNEIDNGENKFYRLLSYYNVADQKYITEYRNLLIKLKKINQTKENIVNNYNEAKILNEKHQKEYDLLRHQYRDLKRLEHNIALANDVHFIYGPLYSVSKKNTKDIKDVDVKSESEHLYSNTSNVINDDSLIKNIMVIHKKDNKLSFRTNDEYFDAEYEQK